MKERARRPLWKALLVAILGIIFSLWNIGDAASVPCITTGCALYRSFTIAGISLWWVGVLAFSVLGFTAIMGWAGLGRMLAGLGVVLDCILLVLMALTEPCLPCMGIAALLALNYAAFRSASGTAMLNTGKRGGTCSLLLGLWAVLFIVDAAIAVRGVITPWAIQAPAEPARTQIYFSLSCGACRQLILSLPDAEAQNVAWYPVSEESSNLKSIHAMYRALGEGKPLVEAYHLAQEHLSQNSASGQSFLSQLNTLRSPELWLLQFRLWVNQAHVMKNGNAQLPFVEFRGLPEALIRSAAPRPTGPRGGQTSQGQISPSQRGIEHDLPFLDLGSAGACTGNTSTTDDCIEPR